MNAQEKAMARTATQLLFTPFVALSLFASAGAGAADVKDRNIKLSYVTAKDSPYGLGVEKYAEIVAKKSDGKLKMKGYSDGQLGAEVASISSAQGGVIEMALVSTAAVSGNVKEFGLFDFPFLFGDEKEVYAVLDGAVGTQLLNKLSDKGVVGLCYWEVGFRHVTNSKHPVTKLEDFRGLKIRTIQNPVFVDVFNTLGANAAPMAFTEVYPALESKALDGQETPYNVIYTSKFYEVQKYLSATKHIYGPGVILVGKKFWDQLSGDEKKILQDACAEARDYERKVSRDLDAKVLGEMKAKGMIVNEISPEEQARMRDKVKSVVEKYTNVVGPDLVKQTYAEIEKVKKQK
jgi:tripartite ATP-independent transporter DctP family solute receptor